MSSDSTKSKEGSSDTGAYQYGLSAEMLAVTHMQSLGYVLLKQRYKSPYGELDLVCYSQAAESLVFVEVKARKALPDRPVISARQIARNCAAAAYFLSQHPELSLFQLRFDYILIHRNQILYHLENAWEYQEPTLE